MPNNKFYKVVHLTLKSGYVQTFKIVRIREPQLGEMGVVVLECLDADYAGRFEDEQTHTKESLNAFDQEGDEPMMAFNNGFFYIPKPFFDAAVAKGVVRTLDVEVGEYETVHVATPFSSFMACMVVKEKEKEGLYSVYFQREKIGEFTEKSKEYYVKTARRNYQTKDDAVQFLLLWHYAECYKRGGVVVDYSLPRLHEKE